MILEVATIKPLQTTYEPVHGARVMDNIKSIIERNRKKSHSTALIIGGKVIATWGA